MAQNTVKVQFQNGYWVLDFKMMLTDVDQGMKACYPEKNWTNMDVSEFNQRVETYLRTKTQIKLDSQQIEMKYISHEINSAKVTAKYISERYEELPKVIEVHCGVLEELEDYQGRLVLNDGNVKRIEKLNSENAFTVVRTLPLEEETTE